MLPRLQSQERLDGINDVAVSSGRLPQHDCRQMVQRLERAAHGGRRTRAARATPAMLGGMGIAVVTSGQADAERGVSDV